MRKLLLLLAATTVLWVPAVSVAGDSSPSSSSPAAKTETLHAESNVGPTRSCDSPSSANSFGGCVSTSARKAEKSDSEDSAENHDKATSHHGGEGDSNTSPQGYGNDSPESHGKNTANPAMTCKAMQADDPAHFRATYGIRANAFGRCVSGHANGKPPNGKKD